MMSIPLTPRIEMMIRILAPKTIHMTMWRTRGSMKFLTCLRKSQITISFAQMVSQMRQQRKRQIRSKTKKAAASKQNLPTQGKQLQRRSWSALSALILKSIWIRSAKTGKLVERFLTLARRLWSRSRRQPAQLQSLRHLLPALLES